MQALNIVLFQWMAAGYSPNAELLWLASRLTASAPWVCTPVIAWMAWRRPSQRGYILMTLAAAALAAVAAHMLANAIHLPRPFVANLSPNYISHGARGSLPSAHATVLFTLAALFLLRPALRPAGWALLAVAMVVGWARIYVGAHFPFDVLAGFLLGAVIAAVFWRLADLCQRRFARGRDRAEPSPAWSQSSEPKMPTV